MTIVACSCPSCSRRLQLKADLAGKRLRCPHCKQVFTAPPRTPPAEPHTASSASSEERTAAHAGQRSPAAPSVEELVSRWQALRRQGQEVSAEQLCAGHPELLADLRRRLEALASMAGLLDVNGTRTLPTVTCASAARSPSR
jgi:hypothetical protein